MQVADRKLAWAAIFTLAVIAVEIAWFLFVGPTEGRPDYTATCKENCDEPWWWSATFWTIAFTALLTGSSFAMWYETRRLARGADNQGHREIASLIPYIQIREAEFEWLPGHAKVIVTVKNDGQMPAKWFEVLYSSASIPIGESWAIPTQLDADVWSNLGGGEVLTASLKRGNFTATAAATLNSTLPTYFFLLGKVRYADIWDNEYETEFAFFTRNAKPTIAENGGGPRKMMRPTGKLQSFRLVKKAG